MRIYIIINEEMCKCLDDIIHDLAESLLPSFPFAILPLNLTNSQDDLRVDLKAPSFCFFYTCSPTVIVYIHGSIGPQTLIYMYKLPAARQYTKLVPVVESTALVGKLYLQIRHYHGTRVIISCYGHVYI